MNHSAIWYLSRYHIYFYIILLGWWMKLLNLNNSIISFTQLKSTGMDPYHRMNMLSIRFKKKRIYTYI